MTLKYKNTDIYYSVSGSGKTVVLLHGFLESGKIWDEFLPEFAEKAQVIVIDLPGHGKSGCIADVHGMELMAEVIYEVLREIGIEKADCIGHSMGGYVSLAFLEGYPKMVNSIMLLNSTPAADSEEKKEIRERSVALVQKNKKAYISMAISNLLSPVNSHRFEAEIQKLKEEAYSFPEKGITAALKGMKIRTDRTAVLKSFSGGKFIVTGKNDPIIEYKVIKGLAEETGSVLSALPGGHLSHLESKEEFKKLCISSNN